MCQSRARGPIVALGLAAVKLVGKQLRHFLSSWYAGLWVQVRGAADARRRPVLRCASLQPGVPRQGGGEHACVTCHVAARIMRVADMYMAASHQQQLTNRT